jgi:hypothetical protein
MPARGPLARWLVEARIFLLLLGLVGLAAVFVLAVPGNPFLDLALHKNRGFGTILSHAAVGLLALGCFLERHRWLEAAARWSPIRAVLILSLVGASVLAALEVLARMSPAYVRLLLWESGPVEPLTVAWYLISAWIAAVHAEFLRSRGAEYRPYRLVVVACIMLALEELDYFGIFGNLLGRIEGTYIGAPHDLLKLVPAHPALGVALAGLGVGGAVVLRRWGFLTAAFIRREALDLTSGPIYLAGVFLVIAQLDDLHSPSVGVFRKFLTYRVEEPLELLGALWLGLGLLMKYGRDRRTT